MKKYVNPSFINTEVSDNQSSNSIIKFFNDLREVAIFQFAVPIAMFLLFLTLGGLMIAAFGKDQYFGDGGKLLIGVGVPIFVILCFVFKQFGNIVFTLWIMFLYLVVIIIPLCWVTFQFMKPVIDYLS